MLGPRTPRHPTVAAMIDPGTVWTYLSNVDASVAPVVDESPMAAFVPERLRAVERIPPLRLRHHRQRSLNIGLRSDLRRRSASTDCSLPPRAARHWLAVADGWSEAWT